MRLIFPDPALSAGGIVLRRLEASDVGWVTAACRDPAMSRFIAALPNPYTEADAIAHHQHAAQGWASGQAATFVIAPAAGPGSPGLGMFELHVHPYDAGMAEVGYWLTREARGRGAATTAVRLVSAWAFGQLGVERLNLVTAPDNVASQRVAERAGFAREGLLRAWTAGRYARRDSVMFSLLAGDPLAAHQA